MAHHRKRFTLIGEEGSDLPSCNGKKRPGLSGGTSPLHLPLADHLSKRIHLSTCRVPGSWVLKVHTGGSGTEAVPVLQSSQSEEQRVNTCKGAGANRKKVPEAGGNFRWMGFQHTTILVSGKNTL